jgi:hypothetical protein
VNLGNIFEGRGEIERARGGEARASLVRDDPLLALRRELICPPCSAVLKIFECLDHIADALADQTAE